MMKFPNKRELKELRAFNQPYSLSIYAPYIEPNVSSNPNRIELKNLLRESETALLSAGVTPKEIKKTLKPAKALLEGREFWPVHHESLVLFAHPQLFYYYHLPSQSIPYMLTVEKGFNLQPLLMVMQANKQYYVLALSHKNVKFYKGDHYQIKQVYLNNFPSNMEETLNVDEYPKARELHMIAPPSMGKGTEAYHGQYNVKEVDKAMLLEFFRRINKRLQIFLQDKHLPIILAGVDYLKPIYHQVNTSPNLIPNGIKGNTEHTKLDNLRDQAWKLLNQKKLK